MNASRLSCALLLVVLGCPKTNSQSEVADTTTPTTPHDDTTPKPKEIRVSGFSSPESVIWDSRSDVYLVSNISGQPTGRDDDGFISRVAPDGTVLELRWIDGKQEGVELSAPKGSCLVDDMLLVTDIDQIRRFDRNNGTNKGSIVIPEAQGLNDMVCTAQGKAWVGDLVTGKLHEISDVKVDQSKPVLDAPGVNGLALDNQDRLWAVAEGKLFRLDPEGKRVEEQTLPNASLDGVVVLDDGTLLVSSWEARAVLYGRPGEVFMPLFEDLRSPADIGYDGERRRLLIPLFEENAVMIRDLP
jgi:sugar lactone lactonase YvrE